eukprot:gene25163-biopygen22477
MGLPGNHWGLGGAGVARACPVTPGSASPGRAGSTAARRRRGRSRRPGTGSRRGARTGTRCRPWANATRPVKFEDGFSKCVSNAICVCPQTLANGRLLASAIARECSGGRVPPTSDATFLGGDTPRYIKKWAASPGGPGWCGRVRLATRPHGAAWGVAFKSAGRFSHSLHISIRLGPNARRMEALWRRKVPVKRCCFSELQ